MCTFFKQVWGSLKGPPVGLGSVGAPGKLLVEDDDIWTKILDGLFPSQKKEGSKQDETDNKAPLEDKISLRMSNC